MIPPAPVLWTEGLFLRAQHFQQQDAHLADRLAQVLALSHPWPWGLQELVLDGDALALGHLRLEALSLTFPDGCTVSAPRTAPLPPALDLATLNVPGDALLLHACLPLWGVQGSNLGSTPEGQPRRYGCHLLEVPDRFGEAGPAEIALLQPSLMLAPHPVPGTLALPVLRLRRSPEGAWNRDDTYLPPALALGALPALIRLLQHLRELARHKAEHLASLHRERTQSVLAFGVSDVASFWLLHAINRTLPLLTHHLRSPAHGPEEVYRTLVAWAGELQTFSSEGGAWELPPYDHQDLTGTFQDLGARIRSLLGTLVSHRCHRLPLQPVREGFLGTRLPADLARQADLYLSVRGDALSAAQAEQLPVRIKVGSPEDVERLLLSALPGIRLLPVPVPPAVLPVRIGNHYFALERQGTAYERMGAEGSLWLHLPASLPDLHLELLAILP